MMGIEQHTHTLEKLTNLTDLLIIYVYLIKIYLPFC